MSEFEWRGIKREREKEKSVLRWLAHTKSEIEGVYVGKTRCVCGKRVQFWWWADARGHPKVFTCDLYYSECMYVS